MAREEVVFVAAHPDDEVLGAGSLLTKPPAPVVVHVTDGAPRDLVDARAQGFTTREAYAAARHEEACAALALAGIDRARVLCLDAIDQEAMHALAPLARRLARLLAALDARTIFTHPYEGGHPDHDASAFVVHAARALLARKRDEPPVIYEFTSYFADPAGHGPRTGVFLSPNRAADPRDQTSDEETVELSAPARALKERMLSSFRTQAAIVASFPTHTERYRPAPRYRFTVAPHAGPLHYETLGWRLSGERWRALAAVALDELALLGSDPL